MESHLERKLLHFNLKQAIETIHCVSPNFKHESTTAILTRLIHAVETA